MSLANPTQLRIGATGNLEGLDYRVVGRVVMSANVSGETYYWNEFNLETGFGENVTLVYEETERGGEWRLFTLFAPEYPMTAEDAATQRVGDPLNLDGTAVQVTLVDKSRVCRIEGKAPEGVEVGDMANYFNAETGSTMIVVSWTGDEVECYRGLTLARGLVEKAFKIARPVLSNFTLAQTQDDAGSKLSNIIVAVAVLAVVFFVSVPSCNLIAPRPPAVKFFSAPPAPLKIGGSGRLNGHNYRIAGHDIVDIAEVGWRFKRHEFQLLDDDGHPALLVCGLKPNAKEWSLFTPLHPLVPLTPQQAGTVHLGETVNVDGVIAPVTELFRSTARSAGDSTLPEADNLVTYGFSGQTGNTLLLARWNQIGITFHEGKLLTDKDVLLAFRRSPGK